MRARGESHEPVGHLLFGPLQFVLDGLVFFLPLELVPNLNYFSLSRFVTRFLLCSSFEQGFEDVSLLSFDLLTIVGGFFFRHFVYALSTRFL